MVLILDRMAIIVQFNAESCRTYSSGVKRVQKDERKEGGGVGRRQRGKKTVGFEIKRLWYLHALFSNFFKSGNMRF